MLRYSTTSIVILVVLLLGIPSSIYVLRNGLVHLRDAVSNYREGLSALEMEEVKQAGESTGVDGTAQPGEVGEMAGIFSGERCLICLLEVSRLKDEEAELDWLQPMKTRQATSTNGVSPGIKESAWETVAEGTVSVPFVVVNDGRRLEIDPTDAELSLSGWNSEFVLDEQVNNLPADIRERQQRAEIEWVGDVSICPDDVYRFREKRLEPGQEVYISGIEVVTADGRGTADLDARLRETDEGNFRITYGNRRGVVFAHLLAGIGCVLLALGLLALVAYVSIEVLIPNLL